MEKPKVILPPPVDRRTTTGGLGLPSDLRAKARRRLRTLVLLVLLAASLDVVLAVVGRVSGHLDHFEPALWGNLLVCGCALAVLAVARPGFPYARLLDVALVFEAVLCLVLSTTGTLTNYRETGHLPLVTWVTPLIILFPMLVPAPPRRVLTMSLLAACMPALGLLILVSAGQVPVGVDKLMSVSVGAAGASASPSAVVIDIDDLFIVSFNPFLAVVFAWFASRTLYDLGLDVAAARRMGSYQLDRPLGQGGMGEVWLAHHAMLARPAAVKLIRSEKLGLDDEARAAAVLKRFEHEAQATAALRSPHTIEIYDFGVTAGGEFYYVMELLDGLDLEEMVTRFGPVPPARAVHLLRQVCHSLAEAHASGHIHRDIKPANLYVCRYGLDADFVKVLDFGLVKGDASHRGDAALTVEGTFHGTPAFMAPEQALHPDMVDGRSDLYAVGCVAYWLLTGHLVFEGGSALEVITQHAHQTPVPASQRSETPIPPALDALVSRCLDKDPALRPQSAEALSEALAASVPGEEWSTERARKWWERHQPVAAADSRG